MSEKKCRNTMAMLCTELGNEIYLEPKIDEMINFYENEGKNTKIYPIISMIGSFYLNYQNTNVSIIDILEIIYENKNIGIMSKHEIHKLLHGIILPKISKKRVLPLI